MARLTASDIVDMVRDGIGGETSETISDTRILRWINQSYIELASRYNFHQLSTSTTVTTTSGTATYELSASDVMNITTVVDDTNNLNLQPIAEFQYYRWTQGNTTSGVPVYWFIDGVGSNSRYNVTFFPTPAGTYTVYVYYTKKPAELVTSPTATSPVIPEAWDDVIVHRAISRGWRYMGDLDAAGKWLGYAREIETAAKKSAYVSSYVEVSPGSRVGRALMDV